MNALLRIQLFTQCIKDNIPPFCPTIELIGNQATQPLIRWIVPEPDQRKNYRATLQETFEIYNRDQ